MTIQERLLKARAAGPRYNELCHMYEAFLTQDLSKLTEFLKNESSAVRFSAYCNPLHQVTSADLKSDPLIKFAACFNPSTSTEILDEIGLHQTGLNPVIPETIHSHKNTSKEFRVFRAITDVGIDESLYEDENDKYFVEAIFDDGEVQNVIDLESLEALCYLYILGFIEAPAPTREFWEYFLDSEPKNLQENMSMFGKLPPIPDDLYEECRTIVGNRCLAGAWTKDQKIMESLVWDKQLLYTGYGGFYWQDSRSPRSSVASNQYAAEQLLRSIFQEEKANEKNLNSFPHPELWRLSCNRATPPDVLEGIIELIEQCAIFDKDTCSELLVGEPEDYPFGLATNPAVKGQLRDRVEKLMRDRNLDPEDFEILGE